MKYEKIEPLVKGYDRIANKSSDKFSAPKG
jgi:hypothetical protein